MTAPPLPADDTLTADEALRLLNGGATLAWQGDYHNARQLLVALERRIARKERPLPEALPEAFHRYRMRQSQRAQLLGRLLVPLDPQGRVALRRGPPVPNADAAFGPRAETQQVPLRAVLGAIGAAQWQERGVDVPALGARVHPHYGVFAPVRGEYVALVAQAPLPPGATLAFDVGTGTGVLAALLLRRGLARVVATDESPAALACARETLDSLGLGARAEVVPADLFPEGDADLVVCNPPWLPAKVTTALDRAVFDPDGAMLRGYLAGVGARLRPGGEAWLVLSDLAEHLRLRTREALLAQFEAGGLRVIERHDARPSHPRAQDAGDPLHVARSREVTSLWRLGRA